MSKKLSVGTLLALLLMLAMSSFAVQAAPTTPEPTPVIQPSFSDGRLNAYDPGAPVAVFETRKTVPIINDNGVPTTADVVNGIQLLFWDGASAKEVLRLSTDDINAVIDKNIAKIGGTNMNSTASANANANNTASTSTAANTTNTNATSNQNLNTTTVNKNNLSGTVIGDSIVIAKQNGYSLNYSKSGYFWISTPPDFEGKVYTFSWQKNF